MGMTKSKPKCPNIHRQRSLRRAIELETAAECEKIRAAQSEIHFIENSRAKKSAFSKLEDGLRTAHLNGRRKVKKLENDFCLRWFLWRSTLPISIAMNIRPLDILAGGNRREFVFGRRLCLWMTWDRGRFSYYRLGHAMKSDHSTIRHSIMHVERALEDGGSRFSLLLDDVIHIEREHKLASGP